MKAIGDGTGDQPRLAVPAGARDLHQPARLVWVGADDLVPVFDGLAANGLVCHALDTVSSRARLACAGVSARPCDDTSVALVRFRDGAVHRIHVAPADTFALEIEHFMHAIRTSQEPITSGRSQRRALEIVLAAYRSMETGQPVRLGSARES
jgi:hypothetical protein